MQSISTQIGVGGGLLSLREGVEDELLVLREGWAVVVLVNATDNGVSLDHTNYFERLFD